MRIFPPFPFQNIKLKANNFIFSITFLHVAVFTMECAAGKCCTLFNIPMEHYPDTGKPRHICMHCRKGVHPPCSLQWADEIEKASRGYSIAISSIHKVGQMEAASFNNDHCLLCFKCCDALNTLNNIM